MSAFHVACASGHADVARRLLVHGSVDINRGTTADGYTALHAACEHGHVEVVNELLKHPDIRVNQGTMRDQMAPIHIACDAAHIDVVRALLAHGRVQLNRPLTAEGATPSHFAAFHGKLPLVQLCGVYGGRFDIPDKDGDLPFSDSDLMASVEPDLKEWMASSRGWSPLRIAAGARLHDDIVAALRVGAMDPDSQDSVQELLAAEATAWTEVRTQRLAAIVDTMHHSAPLCTAAAAAALLPRHVRSVAGSEAKLGGNPPPRGKPPVVCTLLTLPRYAYDVTSATRLPTCLGPPRLRCAKRLQSLCRRSFEGGCPVRTGFTTPVCTGASTPCSLCQNVSNGSTIGRLQQQRNPTLVLQRSRRKSNRRSSSSSCSRRRCGCLLWGSFSVKTGRHRCRMRPARP